MLMLATEEGTLQGSSAGLSEPESTCCILSDKISSSVELHISPLPLHLDNSCLRFYAAQTRLSIRERFAVETLFVVQCLPCPRSVPFIIIEKGPGMRTRQAMRLKQFASARSSSSPSSSSSSSSHNITTTAPTTRSNHSPAANTAL